MGVAPCLLAACVISASLACAQTHPSRPIRLVAAFSAGSTSDILARIIALPVVNGSILKQGETPPWTGAAAFDKMVHADIVTRRKVYSAVGVKPH